ncbi:MAG TPA: hypothetical protein VI248_17390 [Kineosporiaceae bacterium]
MAAAGWATFGAAPSVDKTLGSLPVKAGGTTRLVGRGRAVLAAARIAVPRPGVVHSCRVAQIRFPQGLDRAHEFG